MNRIACLFLVAFLASCATGEGDDPSGDSTGATTTPKPDAGGTVSTDRGVPCNIEALTQKYCLTCHGSTPANGAPMSLVTYEDIAAPSKSNKNKTNAVQALARMRDTSNPMPPAPNTGVPIPLISQFDSWVSDGFKRETCAPPSSGDAGTEDGGGTQPPADGGGAPVDSGSTGTPDTGSSVPDTGSSVPDTGTILDTGIRDTGRG